MNFDLLNWEQRMTTVCCLCVIRDLQKKKKCFKIQIHVKFTRKQSLIQNMHPSRKRVTTAFMHPLVTLKPTYGQRKK